MPDALPAPAEVAGAVLSEAFRDAGLGIRIEPGPESWVGRVLGEHDGSTFVVAAWTQGSPLARELDFGRSLLWLFDTVQQEVSEDQLWGRPLPPCGAHPGHPANAGLQPEGLELYCSRHRHAWTRLIPTTGV